MDSRGRGGQDRDGGKRNLKRHDGGSDPSAWNEGSQTEGRNQEAALYVTGGKISSEGANQYVPRSDLAFNSTDNRRLLPGSPSTDVRYSVPLQGPCYDAYSGGNYPVYHNEPSYNQFICSTFPPGASSGPIPLIKMPMSTQTVPENSKDNPNSVRSYEYQYQSTNYSADQFNLLQYSPCVQQPETSYSSTYHAPASGPGGYTSAQSITNLRLSQACSQPIESNTSIQYAHYPALPPSPSHQTQPPIVMLPKVPEHTPKSSALKRPMSEEKTEAASSSTPPRVMIGRRRGGGRALPIGIIKRPKAVQLSGSRQKESDPEKPWSRYMAEVERYRKETCTDDDAPNRSLVK